MNILQCGLSFLTSPLVGDRVVPQPPKFVTGKGPYAKRRLKRWRDMNPPYYRANGKFVLMEKERTLVCHPDDLPALQGALSNTMPEVLR